MREDFLHFIWKLQLFSKVDLISTRNESIEIVKQGLLNFNSGPDFLNAKVRINGQLWAGNVEIHLKASDWYVHQHEKDLNYNTVILHVVWDNDIEVFNKYNEAIPTIELKSYISKDLLSNYKSHFNSPKKWINCENNISTISKFKLSHFFEQLYFNRLEQKSILIESELLKTNKDWEAILFRLLLKNFGLKVNGEAFLNLGNSINFSVIRKVSQNPFQMEALLFGQAGILEETKESVYFEKLQKEYKYLQSKFKLKPLNNGQIQFFRLRPNNFPTIRLSQIAQLYFKYKNLFSKIMEMNSLQNYYELFKIETSEFWETHYTFEKESKKRVKKLSEAFIDLLLINTIIPIKFKYYIQQGTSIDSILDLIQEIKPEKNTIISKFNELKIASDSAFETQALLQLKNEYCNKLKCLDCTIGKDLLTR
ncbi:DUF2851 family protein [Lutibacter sp. TH_r2]|uniref:DUF2851 family protein n=1 Tax=Lutibacter sp. TH_r2 TaxID=3082083 RepID=UPI0029532BA7|nr:DUF2851 family protein [Lutibacter sp. TH_r2]MDV7185677.1 DUF2851 family protein [Lutibacter sp. TH_r2]